MLTRRTFATSLLLPKVCMSQQTSFGPWSYVTAVDLESKNPGAGVAFRFKAGSAFADIYFYDSGDSWPEGTDSEKFRSMLQQVRLELGMAEKAGAFSDLKFGKADDVVVAGRKFYLLRMTMRRDSTEYVSLMYLSGVRGKLIKFRVTAPEGTAGLLEEDANALIKGAFRQQNVFQAPWHTNP